MNQTKSIPKISYTTSTSLLNAVKASNNKAWDEFYVKYSGMIYAIGKRKNLSQEDCEDLVIDVMQIFWKKMDEFIYDRTRGKFRSYLARIAHNCAMQINSLRKKNNNVSTEELTVEYPADVDQSMMEEWRDFLLEQALENLRLNVDTETYQVFYMSFIQQCSIDEISAVTRKTPNNIYVIRSRCLNKLTALLREFRQLDESLLPCHSNKNNSQN